MKIEYAHPLLRAMQTVPLGVLFKSAILMCAYSITVFCLRRSSAAWRVIVCQVTTIGLFAIPIVCASGIHWYVAILPRSLAKESTTTTRLSSNTIKRHRIADVIAQIPPNDISRSPSRVSTAAPKAATTAYATVLAKNQPIRCPDLGTIALLTIWIAGTLTLSLRTIAGARRLKSLMAHAHHADSVMRTSLQAIMEGHTGRDYQRTASVVWIAGPECDCGPMTWGLWRHIILLPHVSLSWTHDQLEAVLLHEMAHIERHDWIWLMITDLLCNIQWFNPLLWAIRRRMRFEMEIACDNYVLNRGVLPTAYVRALIEVVRNSRTMAGPHRACSLVISMAAGSRLEERLQSALDGSTNRAAASKSLARAAIGAAIVVMTCLTTVNAIEAPERFPQAGTEERTISHDGVSNADHDDSGPGNVEAHPDLLYLSRLKIFNEPGSKPGTSLLRKAAPSTTSYAILADRAESAKDPDIAWGPAVHGMQAGLRSANNRTSYRIGTTVEMEYLVRNTTGVPITFDFEKFPGVAGYISDVADMKGNRVETLGLPVPHTSERITITLKPGGTTVLGLTGMGLAGEKESFSNLDAGSRATNIIVAGPGKYRLRHPCSVHIRGESGEVSLTTGFRSLEILPKHVTVWYPTIMGWQSGLRLSGDRNRFYAGEKVELEYVMRRSQADDVSRTLFTSAMLKLSPIVLTCPDGKIERIPLTRVKMQPFTLPPGTDMRTLDREITVGKLSLFSAESSSENLGSQVGRYSIRQEKSSDTTSGAVEIFSVNSGVLQASGNTIGKPPTLEFELVDNSRFAIWGQAQRGLRIGAAVPGGQTQFVRGDDICFDLYVQNVTNKEVRLSYLVKPVNNLSPGIRMFDEPGGLLHLPAGKPGVSTIKLVPSSLKPGQCQWIGRTYLSTAITSPEQLHEYTAPATTIVWSPPPTSGRYTAEFDDDIQLEQNPPNRVFGRDINGQYRLSPGIQLNTGRVVFSLSDRQ